MQDKIERKKKNKELFFKRINIPNLISLKMAEKYSINFKRFDKDLTKKIINEGKVV